MTAQRGDAFFRAPVTDATGTYAITGLVNGRYHVRVDDCGSSTRVSHWYNGGSGAFERFGAKAVTVGSGTTTVNDKLTVGGSISGTVTAASAGETRPLSGARVVLTSDRVSSTFSAISAADGTYSLTGLPSGQYKVRFGSNSYPAEYADVFYGQASSKELARVLKVTAGSRLTAVNGTLRQGAVATGTISDRTGAPVSGAFVLFESDVNQNSGTTTGADGRFELSGLAVGVYEVSVTSNNVYAKVYYGDTPNRIASKRITISSSTTRVENINIRTYASSTISGLVADPDGEAQSGVCVVLHSAEERSARQTRSSADGTFSFLVSPGHYAVEYNNCLFDARDPSLSSQFYGGSKAQSYYDAPYINVLPGADISGIDAKLPPVGMLRGVIRRGGPSGPPLAGMCAFVQSRQSFSYPSGAVTSSPTDSTGAYVLPQVPPDTYQLSFFDCSGGSRSTSYFTSRTISSKEATGSNPVIVVPGGNVVGLDGYVP